MQLHYILIDRFFLRSNLPGMRLPWTARGNAMTNPQDTDWRDASLDRKCLSFTKEMLY